MDLKVAPSLPEDGRFMRPFSGFHASLGEGREVLIVLVKVPHVPGCPKHTTLSLCHPYSLQVAKDPFLENPVFYGGVGEGM